MLKIVEYFKVLLEFWKAILRKIAEIQNNLLPLSRFEPWVSRMQVKSITVWASEVGDNNYCVAKEDNGSCDSFRHSAVRIRLYSQAVSVCRTDMHWQCFICRMSTLVTSLLRGSGWLTPRPGHFTPGKGYQLYRKLGGPQGRPARMRKISPLPAFDPRTVQPVASRYTDCVLPSHPPR